MATIPAICPCGKQFQANERLAGKRVVCPACGTAFAVPGGPGGGDTYGLSGSLPSAADACDAPSWTQAESHEAPPNYGAYSAAPPKKTNPALIVGIVAGVVGVGFLMILGVAILLPAVQSAREAARRQAAQSNRAQAEAPKDAGSAASGAPMAGLKRSPFAWHTYQSIDGRYSVLMPARVRTQSHSEPALGGVVSVRVATAEVGAEGAFMAGYTDFPNPDSVSDDDVLDVFCSGAMARNGATEISRQSITMLGFPGRELKFRGDQMGQPFDGHSKMFLIGRRSYQLMWVGLPGTEPVEEVEKYFASFQLTPADARSALPRFVRPPSIDGGPSDGTLSETRRKAIYAEATRYRRHIEMLGQQRDRSVAQGRKTSAIDGQIDSLKKLEASQPQGICLRHQITREQLDAIIAEGDTNGWGKR